MVDCVRLSIRWRKIGDIRRRLSTVGDKKRGISKCTLNGKRMCRTFIKYPYILEKWGKLRSIEYNWSKDCGKTIPLV
jgi:hypothetical protein